MKDQKRRIFLTGATGVMGFAGLQELMKYPEKYDISVLSRPSGKNRKKLRPFIEKGLKVLWGDLLDKDCLEEGIANADIVLHVGGMVSPAADHFPQKTLQVNVGSMRLIASIVRDIENSDPGRIITTVYIGSVSQYGPKLPPGHWGGVGDVLKAAKFDAYALSKILAERALLEAGLRRWVSIRQTAILHSGLLTKAGDPVAFHVPLNGVIEWISVEDSGRLLEKICREDIPENFWNNFYNVGGGEFFRLTNYEFERELLKGMGCPPPEKIFQPEWFPTDNFHGIWFKDSNLLDEFLNYRQRDSFEMAMKRLKKELPFYFRLTPLVPAFAIKSLMKKVVNKKGLGAMSWIKENNIKRINASWGSLENFRKIPDWKNLFLVNPSERDEISINNKSSVMNLNNSLRLVQCSSGHEYLSSQALEYGGHGCPFCLEEETDIPG